MPATISERLHLTGPADAFPYAECLGRRRPPGTHRLDDSRMEPRLDALLHA